MFQQFQLLENDENKMICYGVDEIRASRNKKSKWYVSWQEFPDAYMSRYCTGFFLLMKTQLISKMFNESFYVKFFWIDDYWMTAILGKSLNVSLSFLNKHFYANPKRVIGRSYANQLSSLFAIHTEQNLTLLFELWHNTLVKYGYRNSYFSDIFEFYISSWFIYKIYHFITKVFGIDKLFMFGPHFTQIYSNNYLFSSFSTLFS